MSTKSLNKALGIDDDELDKIINSAEASVGNQQTQITGLSQEEIDKFNAKREEVTKLKDTLKLARDMSDQDWARSIIKAGVDNAMLVQLKATQDIEEDYRSNKVQSMSELTNAIVAGAKAVVDITQGDRNLDIQQERNEIRKTEIAARIKTIDASGSSEQTRIGTKKELLKLIHSGSINTSEITNVENNDAGTSPQEPS